MLNYYSLSSTASPGWREGARVLERSLSSAQEPFSCEAATFCTTHQSWARATSADQASRRRTACGMIAG